MKPPFPGMDPYLEQVGIWQQVHNNLITDIQRFLSPVLRPYYRVDIEARTFLAVSPPEETGIPDILVLDTYQPQGNVLVATPKIVFKPVLAELPRPKAERITERYLEIRRVDSQEVITVIEVLAFTNKLEGNGREQYITKRNKILGTLTNLVEIDLLRAGRPMPMRVAQQSHYRLVVSRSPQRPQAEIYLFNVRQPIPDLPIPLRPNEPEPILPLNQLLHELYVRGDYDLKLNYRQPPQPPLDPDDQLWAQTLFVTEHHDSAESN